MKTKPCEHGHGEPMHCVFCGHITGGTIRVGRDDVAVCGAAKCIDMANKAAWRIIKNEMGKFVSSITKATKGTA